MLKGYKSLYGFSAVFLKVLMASLTLLKKKSCSLCKTQNFWTEKENKKNKAWSFISQDLKTSYNATGIRPWYWCKTDTNHKE